MPIDIFWNRSPAQRQQRGSDINDVGREPSRGNAGPVGDQDTDLGMIAIIRGRRAKDRVGLFNRPHQNIVAVRVIRLPLRLDDQIGGRLHSRAAVEAFTRVDGRNRPVTGLRVDKVAQLLPQFEHERLSLRGR